MKVKVIENFFDKIFIILISKENLFVPPRMIMALLKKFSMLKLKFRFNFHLGLSGLNVAQHVGLMVFSIVLEHAFY